MRTGKLVISRGHQLGDIAPSAPRLSLVPREASPTAPVPVSVAQRTLPPAFEPAAPSSPAPAVLPAPAVTPEYAIVHDRLTAIERLARLRDLGALSADEFEAEKSIVLGLPADELVLHESLAPGPAEAALAPVAPVPAPHRPTLIGRLLGWHLVPIGLVAGLAFSFAAQPRETWRFFDEALRLLGA